MGIERYNKVSYTFQIRDNQVIIANDKDDLEDMIRKLVQEYEIWE